MTKNVNILTSIQRLSASIARLADKQLHEKYSFGMSQFKIMWLLNTHQEGVLQANLAKWLNQTEAAISRQVGILTSDYLVEMHQDPNDKRRHKLFLSTKGQKFVEQAMAMMSDHFQPVLAVLTKTEQHQLAEMLDRLFYKTCK